MKTPFKSPAAPRPRADGGEDVTAVVLKLIMMTVLNWGRNMVIYEFRKQRNVEILCLKFSVTMKTLTAVGGRDHQVIG